MRILHHRRNRILRALSELRLAASERASLRIATASASFSSGRSSGGSGSIGGVLASYDLARASFAARRGGATYLGGPLPGSTLQGDLKGENYSLYEGPGAVSKGPSKTAGSSPQLHAAPVSEARPKQAGSRTVTTAEFEDRIARVETAFQAQLKSISATLGGAVSPPVEQVGAVVPPPVEQTRKAAKVVEEEVELGLNVAKVEEKEEESKAKAKTSPKKETDPAVTSRLQELEARLQKAEDRAATAGGRAVA